MYVCMYVCCSSVEKRLVRTLEFKNNNQSIIKKLTVETFVLVYYHTYYEPNSLGVK